MRGSLKCSMLCSILAWAAACGDLSRAVDPGRIAYGDVCIDASADIVGYLCASDRSAGYSRLGQATGLVADSPVSA